MTAGARRRVRGHRLSPACGRVRGPGGAGGAGATGRDLRSLPLLPAQGPRGRREMQVNVGCVPKKVMFNAAVHAEFIRDHADYGFSVTSQGFDFA